MKKDDIIFLSIAIIVAGIILVNIVSEDTILGVLTESIREPEWDELKPRDIVKNTIPITVLEKNGNCLVSAEKLDIIFDHAEFIQSDSLQRELNYDREKNTIKIGCGGLTDDAMHFHIWFVIPEASESAERFTYFITDTSIGITDSTIPK